MGEEEVGLQDVTQGGYKALRQGKKFFWRRFGGIQFHKRMWGKRDCVYMVIRQTPYGRWLTD